MKPYPIQAMHSLISQIKDSLPFNLTETEICAGICVGCPKKMMEYISFELDYWECGLQNGETPTLRDINNLARIGKKVHRSLTKNSLV